MVDSHESSLVKQKGDWAVIERATVARAREELAEEVRFVSALLDTASAMIVSVDTEGRIIRCNDSVLEVLGRQRDEVEGQIAWDVVPWPKERILARIHESRVGATHAFESSLHLGDGRELRIAWTTASVPDEDGSTAFVVATGQDITLHREAESKLRLAYDVEHRVASTLQESLLRAVPEIPGVRIGVSYKPAVEAERVGGDFYDIFQLPDDRVVAVIGDVSGKGIVAAGLTETVRSTLRTLLYMGLTPAESLTQANRVLRDQTRTEQFATVAVAVLDTRTGELTYAAAGHPYPLLIADKSELFEVPSDPPLGAFEHEFGQTALHLAPSECLVMYTDGLSEARDGGGFFGDHLVEAASRLPRDPEAVVEGLLAEAIAFAGKLSDDIAILALCLDA